MAPVGGDPSNLIVNHLPTHGSVLTDLIRQVQLGRFGLLT